MNRRFITPRDQTINGDVEHAQSALQISDV
jgi:hypothetical protein